MVSLYTQIKMIEEYPGFVEDEKKKAIKAALDSWRHNAAVALVLDGKMSFQEALDKNAGTGLGSKAFLVDIENPDERYATDLEAALGEEVWGTGRFARIAQTPIGVRVFNSIRESHAKYLDKMVQETYKV